MLSSVRGTSRAVTASVRRLDATRRCSPALLYTPTSAFFSTSAPASRSPKSTSSPTNTQAPHRFTVRPANFRPSKSQPPKRNGAPRQEDVHQYMNATLEKLHADFIDPQFLASLQLTRDQFDAAWLDFEREMQQWAQRPNKELKTLVDEASRRRTTLESRIRYHFYARTCNGRFTAAELDNQAAVADLRHPAEWYPATRGLQRTVHMHVGPTNSGKTYHALKRLEEAKSGIFLGPLRLLAHEVYTRLNAKGRPCALITGEEQRIPEGEEQPMYSCTVEMAPLNTSFDVAVIDEFQLINHAERGWAWTQAFFGLQAREIHLCGEARTVPLMRELCALVGDKVHVHEYKRLTPLEVQPRSLEGKLDKLEKGDCIVAFSVMSIHILRQEIEKRTGKKCAMVYGSLPPETRAQQARLFNDPDNDYDYLVASDAIGMGLNLAIKRVIFNSTMKSDGVNYVALQTADVKQIAGRAGRYKTAHDAVAQGPQKTIAGTAADPAIDLDDKTADQANNKDKAKAKAIGWVTTLDHVDHKYLKAHMQKEPEPITTAGLFPPSIVVERFANYFPPGTPFSYILLRLHEISEIHPRFHLCELKDQLAVADAIHTVENLSIHERIVLCAAPINMRDAEQQKFFRTLAECIANGSSGNLLDLPDLSFDVMDSPMQTSRGYLYHLEQLHKKLVCYLWLSYRFPNIFTTRTLANHAKKLLEDQIEHTLRESSHTERARSRMNKQRKLARQALETLEGDENTESLIEEPQSLNEDPESLTEDAKAARASADAAVAELAATAERQAQQFSSESKSESESATPSASTSALQS
jgi:ATP-dependent RNA helicase SUPV3L1/SUV3